MAKLTRLLALSAVLGCSAATACGGQSLQHGGDDGAGTETGGSDSGGATSSGSGGAAATGGSSAATSGTAGVTGGTAGVTAGTAGTVSVGGGGTAGVGGTAGAGGEPGICFLEPDPGPCLAAMGRFAFDPDTGLCRPFTYGGCDGNENNFETVESCYATCGGQGAFDPAACTSPFDCTLMPSECCGDCRQATLGNVVAVNTRHTGLVHMAMGCHLVDCIPCEAPVKNPWLGATCLAGRCVAFDARQSDLTACNESDDCRVRAGLGCCENCAPAGDEYVAVNRSFDAEPLLCGGIPTGCDTCVPFVPEGLAAYCSEQGRCDLVQVDF